MSIQQQPRRASLGAGLLCVWAAGPVSAAPVQADPVQIAPVQIVSTQAAPTQVVPPVAEIANTLLSTDRHAYSQAMTGLSASGQDEFILGRAFFRNPWVTAPSSTTARDGLGPLFNARSCRGCHPGNGRGQPPLPGQPMRSMLLRLSGADHYGSQFNEQGIPGVPGEGRVLLDYQPHEGTFADGTVFELQQPVYRFESLNYGPLGENLKTSARVAPALVGLGLLSAIDESDLQAVSDPLDNNGDGISGRFNRLPDPEGEGTVTGRFGWKANQPSVYQQVAAAFINDLGVTSSLFPEQSCSQQQQQCREAPKGGEPEISDDILAYVSTYTRSLAVPAQRNTDDPRVKAGARLFTQAGCALCHVPTWKTGRVSGHAELSEQTIHPYTDLLLHDMGPGLADGRADFLASGSEWRTPPLWGIGLVPTVNGHSRYLHDGRARNLLEAVLWHGGEAQAARDRVLMLDAAEREALLHFLKSV